MNKCFSEFEDALLTRGWAVQRHQGSASDPKVYLVRYPWLPDDVIAVVNRFDAVMSPSQKAWLTTHAELAGETDSAFAWNPWEIDSLSAAEGDSDWQESIRAFWNEHFPLLLSLKSGYAYIAIRKDLRIVAGEETEFEETEPVADTFSSFVNLLAEGNSVLDRWV